MQETASRDGVNTKQPCKNIVQNTKQNFLSSQQKMKKEGDLVPQPYCSIISYIDFIINLCQIQRPRDHS